MTQQTNTSSIGSVSFLNLFGIFTSIVLCVLFIILGGHSLKYFKAFACKIKIIVNRAEDKNVQLKDYNYKGKENAQKSQAYEQMEAIFKNEIRKSRSLQYWNIMKNLIAKYDHILYYPFRDKESEKYDLLKPKTTFYVLLFICTCCIAWMTTIFLSAILQSSYSDVTLITLGTFAGLTVAISFISGILNLIATNRLFRIYLLNVKAAFKVDYGHQFLALDQGLQDYMPENSQEEEDIFKHQGILLKNQENSQEFDNLDQENDQQQSQNDLLASQRGTYRDDMQLNSSRKLLGEEFERSDSLNKQPTNQKLREEQKEEDEDLEEQKDNSINNNNIHNSNINNSLIINNGPNDKQLVERGNSKQTQRNNGKKKALKDIFDMQVDIEGADDANQEDKYIFVEDKHAIGDMDLLDNEATKGENKSNLTTFIILFIIIAVASAVSCYLNYTFQKTLAQAVFIMFIVSFFGDILVVRPLLLLLLSLIVYLKAKKKGYQRVEYQTSKEVKQVLTKAIKDMFSDRLKLKEDTLKKREQTYLNTQCKNNESQMNLDDEYHTQHVFDKNDTTMNKLRSGNSYDKDDQFAQEINIKKNDDFDGAKVSAITERDAFHPTDFARPQIEELQKKNFEQTQALTYHTSTYMPLLQNINKALQEKENEELENIMLMKQLTNDLVDYNLLLLRKIYDAYEQRADKVLRNFRSDRHGVLRKRYMVPVLNPNYDYEKLLRDMAEAGKVGKDQTEEESVHLDGETVCEDMDKQIIEAIIQEASDNLSEMKVDRQKIDKFGNPIDEEKFKDGINKACPLPEFGFIQLEAEDIIEEDDEEARKRRQLELLRQKLADGEELTPEELALLRQLEDERLQELEKLIQNLLKKGYDNLSDEDKLKLIGYQKEKVNILLGQVLRKNDKTDEDYDKIKEYEDELKRLEYEELLLKKKLNILTPEEQARLQQLEDQKLADILRRIQELQKIGWDNLKDEQKLELVQLQKYVLEDELTKLKNKQPPLREEDLLRIQEIEKQLKELDYQELLLKSKLGLLNDDEKRRLNKIQDQLDAERMALEEAERKAQEEAERQAQEDELRMRELSELEELRKKLMNGDITEEELRRLRELEEKYGLEPAENPFDQQMHLNEEFEDNMQDDQQEELYQDDSMHSRITDQNNFSELPPVQVMNNFNSPQDPEKLLENIDEQDDQQLDSQNRSQIENVFLQKDTDYIDDQQHPKGLDDDLAFGHDDLEFGQITANPDVVPGEESIYSHKTTTILDEEKVSFMHIEHLPNQDNGSEDSFSEQDMVYYNKDDLTNYSKGLGLNKIRARNAPGQQYYSENDLHEVQEGEFSEADNSQLGSKSGRSGRSLDHVSFQRSREMGHLTHNELNIPGHEDLIDGRVKVDAWNMNYRKKKKKNRKKKITNKQRNKMQQLQDIYGIDAKTLAGLSKGRLPRQMLATGKLKGDGFGRPNSKMFTDNSFRSTQNTFQIKQTPAGNKLKQSEQDAQSNIFSFNGFGTKMGWNDSSAKVGQSNQRNLKGSQYENTVSQKKQNPLSGLKKLTRTQQNFTNASKGNGNYQSIQDGLEEESKSVISGSDIHNNGLRSRSRANTKNQTLNNGFNNQQSKSKARKGTKKNGVHGANSNKRLQNNRRGGDNDFDDGIDSHQESDEAVDDKGDLFQRRNGPFNFESKGRLNNSGDHTESEENNQDIPNFDGNNLMFRKRGTYGNEASGQDDTFKNRNKSIGQSQKRQGNQRSRGRNQNNINNQNEDDIDFEDLEAQVQFTGKKGAAAARKTNQKNSTSKNRLQNNLFGRQSAERFGSDDDESIGGHLAFKKRNTKPKNDGFDEEIKSGSKGLKNKKLNDSSINQLNLSNQKPPLSGRKHLKNGNNKGDGSNLHRNSSNNFNRLNLGNNNDNANRIRRNSQGLSEISDNSRFMKNRQNSSHTARDSDNEMFGRSSSNGFGRNGAFNKFGNSHSKDRAGKRNRSIDIRRNQDSENEDDYIVGPESNHSTIKRRPFGHQGSLDDNDRERYLLYQRERQIMEDLQSNDGEATNRLAKKRKIRKAANSQNPKDIRARRFQEQQNERLRKKQREAEAALFGNPHDLQIGQTKVTKKKIKKDMVKKEINYWLDYDSPYAEYLVARFREWSPNPNMMRVNNNNHFNFNLQGQTSSTQRKGSITQSKYKEVANVYQKADNERKGSQQSRSRSKGKVNNHLNLSQQKSSKKNTLRTNEDQRYQNQQQNVNTLFVNDYDEDE